MDRDKEYSCHDQQVFGIKRTWLCTSSAWVNKLRHPGDEKTLELGLDASRNKFLSETIQIGSSLVTHDSHCDELYQSKKMRVPWDTVSSSHACLAYWFCTLAIPCALML